MTDREKALIDLIRQSKDPSTALLTAINIITTVLKGVNK